MKEMTLEIKNFGPINEAKIDIGKINVIAGQNASGKTTSSKLFYCLLASVSSDGEYLAEQGIKERLSHLIDQIGRIAYKDYPEKGDELIKIAISLRDFPFRSVEPRIPLQKIFNETVNIFENLEFKNKESYDDDINQIKELLEIKDNNEIFNSIINTLIRIEFDGSNQIIDNFNDSVIYFHGKYNDCEFLNKIINKDSNAKGTISENYLNCIKVNEVSYIETPYIFDFMTAIDLDLPRRQSNYHQKLLMKKLRDIPSEEDVYDEIVNKNIIEFEEKIREIINGKFKFDSKTEDFKFEKDGKSFTIKNTAAGLKQIGIIQLLLENRKLPKNSYLIMDEPEVHLHPEWQIKLAEIIVLLAKELNVTLYINSHSPQFIEAIEVYSEYHDIKDDTNFYLTEKTENGKFNINKIERDNLVELYDCLGKPYDRLDSIRGEIDANEVIKGWD